MNSQITYSVSILCGGKSTRMGRDKALLDWNGKPLLQHIAGSFSSCSDLFLSVRDEHQYTDFPYRKVCDQVMGSGPLAGLCASLQAAVHDILFITTCDAPLVDAAAAGALVCALKEHDCAVPVSEQSRIHPLIAVYRKSVLPAALDHLKMNDLRIRSLLRDLDTFYYPAENLPSGELTLANLNTPEEAEKLRNYLHS